MAATATATPCFRELVDAQPEPDSLHDAVAPLVGIGLDAQAIEVAADTLLDMPVYAWYPTDWRHTRPSFNSKHAAALHICTLRDPDVFGRLSEVVNNAARSGMSSGDACACLPFIKLLDCAIVATSTAWGSFFGQMARASSMYSFRDYDAKGYTPISSDLYWSEYTTGGGGPAVCGPAVGGPAPCEAVFCREYFCGGNRCIRTGCEGVLLTAFSHNPALQEMIFRPGTHFASPFPGVEPPEHIYPHAPAAGVPDVVHACFHPRTPTNALDFEAGIGSVQSSAHERPRSSLGYSLLRFCRAGLGADSLTFGFIGPRNIIGK
jgi:hypothetical protein